MLNISIPSFFDSAGKEISGLFDTLRKIAFFAVAYDEIIRKGAIADLPTTGRRFFYYATDTQKWYAFTGDTAVGTNGWLILN